MAEHSRCPVCRSDDPKVRWRNRHTHGQMCTNAFHDPRPRAAAPEQEARFDDERRRLYLTITEQEALLAAAEVREQALRSVLRDIQTDVTFDSEWTHGRLMEACEQAYDRAEIALRDDRSAAVPEPEARVKTYDEGYGDGYREAMDQARSEVEQLREELGRERYDADEQAARATAAEAREEGLRANLRRIRDNADENVPSWVIAAVENALALPAEPPERCEHHPEARVRIKTVCEECGYEVSSPAPEAEPREKRSHDGRTDLGADLGGDTAGRPVADEEDFLDAPEAEPRPAPGEMIGPLTGQTLAPLADEQARVMEPLTGALNVIRGMACECDEGYRCERCAALTYAREAMNRASLLTRYTEGER
jgi:hypothetical protein